MIFHRYRFHPLYIQQKTCKDFESILNDSGCYFRDHHPSPPLGRFCWKPNISWGALLSQHPQLSGLKRSWCQGALWHHRAAELGKLSPSCFMREKQSMLFVPMPLSLSVRVHLWSFSLLCPRAHLWTIKAMEHGRVPAIWMWPSANCLHQHTLPLQPCLDPCIPVPPHLTSLAITLPQHQTSESTHETLSLDWDSFFYNACSVSSFSVEPQIPNCGTSKI